MYSTRGRVGAKEMLVKTVKSKKPYLQSYRILSVILCYFESFDVDALLENICFGWKNAIQMGSNSTSNESMILHFIHFLSRVISHFN